MRKPHGLTLGQASHAWRALPILLLALAMGGAGQTSLAQAAGSSSIGIWLQATQVGARRTLCVGDTVQVRLTVLKRIGVEGNFALRLLAGVNIAASVVGSGGVGTISPPSSYTALNGTPPGATYFAFKAEKPGTVIVAFRASVNPVTFLGFVVSSNTVRTQTLFQVEDCKYRVSATSRWTVPGEARINLLARIQIAGMVEDGGGHYRGTARVQWFVSDSQVGDCQGTLTPDSQAEVVGQVFGPDEFVVDISYDTATVKIVADCQGTGGTREVQVSPDQVTFTVPTTGGQQPLSQMLRGPGDTPGSVTVIVKRATGQ